MFALREGLPLDMQSVPLGSLVSALNKLNTDGDDVDLPIKRRTEDAILIAIRRLASEPDQASTENLNRLNALVIGIYNDSVQREARETLFPYLNAGERIDMLRDIYEQMVQNFHDPDFDPSDEAISVLGKHLPPTKDGGPWTQGAIARLTIEFHQAGDQVKIYIAPPPPAAAPSPP